MRKWLLLSALASAIGLAGSASAAPLNWQGTFSTILSDLGVISNSGGGVATINGSAGGVPAHLSTLRLKASRGGVTATETIFITDPDTIGNSIALIQVAASLGTGTLAPISGALQNTSLALTSNVLPVRGTALLCLVDTSCNNTLTLLLTQSTTVNGLPGGGIIGVGVGGLLTVGGDSPIRISLEAAPWTIKTASAVDQILTPNSVNTTLIIMQGFGFAHDPTSMTSQTGQPSGVVQLVTPAQVTTNLALGTAKKLGIIIPLRIHFIPEPGLLLLIGSGAVGLVVLGRKRLRK